MYLNDQNAVLLFGNRKIYLRPSAYSKLLTYVDLLLLGQQTQVDTDAIMNPLPPEDELQILLHS